MNTESAQGYNIKCDFTLKVRPLTELHNWDEIADLSFTAQRGVDAVSTAETAIAPHIMEQAIRIERDLAEANPSMNAVDLAAATLSAFNGKINQQVARLRQEQGWEKTDLPRVAHQTVRKVRGALEYGGSLRTLQTSNKCAEFARDRKKEAEKAAAEAIDRIQGNTTATADDDVKLPPEVQQSLDELISLAKQAAIMDATTANAAIVKARNAMNNIVQTAKSRLAKRAEQKAA